MALDLSEHGLLDAAGTQPPRMKYSVFSVQDHYPDQSRTVRELYDQVMAQAELADNLGYDTFYVAEHHFHEYGAVPNPAVMLSSIAQRTNRIRLGSAISILTFHNPLTVAESYAMVDVLSNGRLVYGVGSGYLKHEFEGYGVNGAEKRERFDEALMLVERLLSGERVTHQGKYWSIDGVQLNVLPLQRPNPPLHVAILRKDAAYWIGRQGRRIIAVPYASVDRWDEIGELVREYRRGQKEGGHPASGDDVVLAFHTHVAESEAEVRRVAEAPFDLYVATRLYARRQTYDDIIRSGLSLFGDVEAVTDKLVQLHAWGVGHVMHLQNFGALPAEYVHRSMRLIAQEVTPRVNARIAQLAQAAE